MRPSAVSLEEIASDLDSSLDAGATQPPKSGFAGFFSLRTAISLAILAFQLALAFFLMEDSARFYTAVGQKRPLIMSVLTEAALIVSALIYFSEKVWWFLNKVMLGAIVFFLIFLVRENSQSQLGMSTFQHASLTHEAQTIEEQNSSLRKSIAELEARSRVTLAGKLHDQLAGNNLRLQAINDQQRALAKPMTGSEADVMFYFRLGAVLMTIVLARYQRSLWRLSSPF